VIRSGALALLVLAASAARAEILVIEVLPLTHRPSEEVVPILRELVEPGGSVTGANDQIIVRSTPGNLAQLKSVLAALDTKPLQLRISVRQSVAGATSSATETLAARIASGDVAAGVGGPNAGPGAILRHGDGENGVAYRSYRTHGADERAESQFVTALEGRPAFISSGQLLPLPQTAAVLTPYGASVHQGIAYHEVGSGFYVTPRVHGDEVSLDISPYAAQPSRAGAGAVETRGLTGAARGKLNQWIPLGGAAERAHDSYGHTLHATARQASAVYDVWVKVEVVP
jgi:type II secretory pathway component GspD/PulD (secretin)